MRKPMTVLLIFLFTIFSGTMALANGLNLNSLGSKALSMGGAFVGLADDYSAIFWNPAGIANFDNKYFGFSGKDVIPSGSYKLDVYVPGQGNVNLVDATSQSKLYLAGIAAYYHPVSENFVTGIGVYTPSNFGLSWDGADFAVISPHATASIDWGSKITTVTISPAIAFKISDQISIGAALNINYGMFDIALHSGRFLLPLPYPPYFMDIDLGQYELNMTGWGYGATIGVLFNFNDIISLGATFRNTSATKFKGEATVSGMSELGAALGMDVSQSSDVETEITWPMWLGVGVAIKPIRNFTFTADLQWTQWSKIDVMKIDYKETFWQNIMAQKYKDKMLMEWNSALQIRIGAEYKSNNLAIRGGFYIDPSPAQEITIDVFFPCYDYKVITFGLGYKLRRLQIDFGFEYFIANEVASEKTIVWPRDEFEPGWQFPMPGTYNMKIIVPTFSISYKF